MIAAYALRPSSVRPDLRRELEVSLNSLLKNTRLLPVVIYDGSREQWMKAWESRGVRFVFDSFRYSDELHKAYEGRGEELQQRGEVLKGVYLRFEVPALLKRERLASDFALYVDTDVIFNRCPVELLSRYRPPIASACAETFFEGHPRSRPWPEGMNAGILYMNIDGFTAVTEEILESALRREFQVLDQRIIKDYFATRPGLEPMDNLLNWKHYWGANPEAYIFHFHGPVKIDQLRRLAVGSPVELPPIDGALIPAKEMAAHYVEINDRYLCPWH